MRCFLSILRWALTLLILAVAGLWTFGAITYLPDVPDGLRPTLSIVLALSCLLVFFPRLKWPAYLVLASLTLGMIALFFSTTASQDRNWSAAVARLPYAEFTTPSNITIRNIRNFRYKSETDFIPEYYDKTFNLDELTSVDFLASYWSSRSIAHIMVSFGFAEKEFISFSIETRPEAQESYSTFAGFYRNFELIYVVADERDVVALRTSVRQPNEQVHLFRSKIPPVNAKKLFLKYLEEINRIHQQPSFYNTLTTNCTSQVLWNIQSYNPAVAYNWKILLSGYLPDLLYETESVDTSKPFLQFFEEARVNERANVDFVSEGFSGRIRQGLRRPGYAEFNQNESPVN